MSTISWRTLPCTLTICLHLRERKDCVERLTVWHVSNEDFLDHGIYHHGISDHLFQFDVEKDREKMHCGVKFQPYFQEQSSILSQIYLRDIFCLSWRDLILWKASPQVMCGINMVLWSHSWNREKIHFWTLSKMNVWKNTREVQNGCFKFHSIPVTWSYTLVALLDTSDIPQRLKAPSPWALFIR